VSKLVISTITTLHNNILCFYAGASIPWGNETEIFIIAILGRKFGILGRKQMFLSI